MALTINTNMMSLYAQNNLMKSQSSLSNALQQLSSGLRVQNAASDASGYYSSQLMTGDINGMGQAIRNANDGVSLAQTAGGAMQQISDALQRINQLAVEAANGTVSSAARGGIQKEVNQLTQQISQIVTTTKYAGTQLLSGSNSITFQIGQNGSTNDQITAQGVTLTGLHSFNASLTNSGTVSVSSQAAASASISNIQADIKTVASESATFGAIQNRFTSVVANLTNSQQNLTAARSTIVDTNYAAQTAALSRAQILQQAGVSMLAQANTIPQLALKLLG
jgi:flagellin